MDIRDLKKEDAYRRSIRWYNKKVITKCKNCETLFIPFRTDMTYEIEQTLKGKRKYTKKSWKMSGEFDNYPLKQLKGKNVSKCIYVNSYKLCPLCKRYNRKSKIRALRKQVYFHTRIIDDELRERKRLKLFGLINIYQILSALDNKERNKLLYDERYIKDCYKIGTKRGVKDFNETNKLELEKYQRKLAKIKKDYVVCECFITDLDDWCKHIKEQANKIQELTIKMIGK